MKRLFLITFVFFFVGFGFSQETIQEVRVMNLSTKRTTDQVYNLRQEQKAALEQLQTTSEEGNVIADEGLSYIAQQNEKSLILQMEQNNLLQQQLDQDKKNAWSWWEVLLMMLLGSLLLWIIYHSRVDGESVPVDRGDNSSRIEVLEIDISLEEEKPLVDRRGIVIDGGAAGATIITGDNNMIVTEALSSLYKKEKKDT